tara:strand:- start:531 stop:1439 length:909 start_codon:yes stop_codon:yes gene_type:complete
MATSLTTDKNIKPKQKKRGRKPKGGKILNKDYTLLSKQVLKPQNIILHLKCTINDLNLNNLQANGGYTPNINEIKPNDNKFAYQKNNNILLENNVKEAKLETVQKESAGSNVIDEIKSKIKALANQLHHNEAINNKSDCFWCTCPFTTSEIYIPKFKTLDTYQVYGCFCSPECATGFLFNEAIDESIKFERHQLLNNIYGNIFNYTKSFKPAPPPYYLLKKYCGSLTIEEYRALHKTNSMIIMTEKPLTRIMPEICENSNFLYDNAKNITINNNTTYKIRTVENKQNNNSKSNIITKTFKTL